MRDQLEKKLNMAEKFKSELEFEKAKILNEIQNLKRDICLENETLQKTEAAKSVLLKECKMLKTRSIQYQGQIAILSKNFDLQN